MRIIIIVDHSRGAQGALLVFDVTDRGSFEHVKKWYERAKQLGGEYLEVLLVGNKIDLPSASRVVSSEEAEQLANELNIMYVETSALDGTNVELAFVRNTQNIKRSVDERGLTGVKSGNLVRAGGVQLGNQEKRSSLFRCNCG